MEWQPIETAPMDGTRVLVATPYDGVLTSHWEGGIWQGLPWRKVDYAKLARPHSWMPLPAFPSPAGVDFLVHRKEMEEALARQRRYFSHENDEEHARLKAAQKAIMDIYEKAMAVCWYDWSDNDPDACEAVSALAEAVNAIGGISEPPK